MKKLSLFIFAILISVCAFAQDSHLKFMGIPIDGSMSVFMTKLRQKGFVLDRFFEKSKATMTGRFTGEDCTLYIIGSTVSNSVYSVSVFYPKKDLWLSLKNDYREKKKLYTEKYGNPSICEESFGSSYKEGDGYEMQAISNGECFYITMFEVNGGKIDICIGTTKGLIISYTDTQNEEKAQNEERTENLNDI